MPIVITILYLFCGIIAGTIGLLSILKAPHSKAHQAYALFTLSVIVWMIGLYFGYFFGSNYALSLGFIRLAYAASLYLGLFLAMFFYHFPFVTVKLPRWSSRITIIGTVIFSFVSGFTPLVEKAVVIVDGVLVGDEFGPLYNFYSFYFFGVMIFAAYLGTKKMLMAHGIEKQKIMLAAFGCYAFLFFGIITNVLLPIFGIFIFQMESVSFTLFFLLPSFYSMQRHRFFNISNTWLRFIRNIITLAAFLLLIAILTPIFINIFSHEREILAFTLSAASSLIIIKWFETFLPEMTPSSTKELRDTLSRFKSELYHINTFQTLTRSIELIFVVSLHISPSKVMLVRKRQADIKIPIYIKDEYIELLEKTDAKIIVSDELDYEYSDTSRKIKRFLNELGAKIAIPLKLEKNIIGLFLLGSKDQEIAYNREEIEELINMQANVEITFINILFRANLEEENNLMKKIIGQKTKNLRSQNAKIKELLKQQSDFIAVTAHEFRTPLNIAILQLEDTLESYSHSDGVLQDMKTMESSLLRLKNLTQRLFDVQQYDLNKVKLYPNEVNIHAFVAEAYNDFREIMKEKGIEFEARDEIKDNLKIRVDESQMRQVIQNLLTNAVKFTPTGGKIILGTQEIDRKIKISVEDNGHGVPDEYKKQIFEKFQTAKADMGMGIGMGLYICKKIIELHKGVIGVADTPGGGATFYFELSKSSLI